MSGSWDRHKHDGTGTGTGAPGPPGLSGDDGDTGWGFPGPAGPQGLAGAGSAALYDPGTVTVASGSYLNMTKYLILTTSERVTLEGDAQLRVN